MRALLCVHVYVYVYVRACVCACVWRPCVCLAFVCVTVLVSARFVCECVSRLPDTQAALDPFAPSLSTSPPFPMPPPCTPFDCLVGAATATKRL